MNQTKDVCVYRRRTLTFMLMVLFGAVTVVMIVGLVQSYFPRYTGLSDLKITGTGRTISIIFMLFMAAVTWRYVISFIRRGSVPVIRITPSCVHLDVRMGEPEDIYFHDVASFSPIEGNFETAVVNYRVDVPAGSPHYPASIEIPLGLTMTRSEVLAVLNDRAARGASQPAPPVDRSAAGRIPREDTRDSADAKNLPPVDRTVRVYWERTAPVVLELGVLALIGVMGFIKSDPDMSGEYLWFISLSTWCDYIIGALLVVGAVIFVYLCMAIATPKLVLYPDSLRYRGQTVRFADLRDAIVESKRKRVAQNRYVTEHFIHFNYKPGSAAASLPGLDTDLLEMRPRRIAAIINSRIAAKNKNS